MKIMLLPTVFAWITLLACANDDTADDATPEAPAEASVTQVAVSGEALNYTCSVTVASPNTGCEQYKNLCPAGATFDENHG